MDPSQLSVIILAAGKGQRFGSIKQHYFLPTGESLLSTSIEIYQTVFGDVSVVVREDDLLSQKSVLQSNAHVVINPHAEQGMSQSIVAGVRERSDASAWLIALADMPHIRQTTLRELAEQARGNRIVVPQYQGQQGNPVVFGQNFQSSLLALSGDVGAKAVIRQFDDCVVTLETDDEGTVHDIDTPEQVLL